MSTTIQNQQHVWH